ncbi:MAG: hypothetical protein KF889_16960 [Alphaproteobacteria bacterium]|nr:hypothetical protein [Alphaproteobacteria bacterium]MCW5739939.1 hypothetical protein [Alphaproteobacteria bacterium]
MAVRKIKSSADKIKALDERIAAAKAGDTPAKQRQAKKLARSRATLAHKTGKAKPKAAKK